uniref:AAA-ATPase-like domain-containing protein n=1 Tax=Clastoptera arizonana TaxID=38151 RepID=A0A1B6C124_9HEMI
MFKWHQVKISQRHQFFVEHCGKYPVIYIDFSEVKAAIPDKMAKDFRKMLQKVLKSYYYLTNSPKLTKTDKKRFKQLSSNILDQRDDSYLTTLPFLMKLLVRHFNNKTILLLDNVDRPVYNAIFQSKAKVIKCLQWVNKVLVKIFEDNPNFKSSMLTATLDIPYDIVAERFKLLERHAFTPYYGVTEGEVADLLERHNYTTDLETLANWYGGYGKPDSDVTLYNTRSVTSYFRYGVFRNYFGYPDGLRNLKDLFLSVKIHKKLYRLIRNMTQEVELEKIKIVPYLRLVQKFSSRPIDSLDDKMVAKVFLHFLMDNGYLRLVDKQENTYKFKITNLEVRQHMEDKFFSIPYFTGWYSFDYAYITDFNKAWSSATDKREGYKKAMLKLRTLFTPQSVPKNTTIFQKCMMAFIRDNPDYVFVEPDPMLGHNNNIVMIRKDGYCVVMLLSYITGTAEDNLHSILSKKYSDVLKGPAYAGYDITSTLYMGFHMDREALIRINYLIDSPNIKEFVLLENLY